MNSTGQIPAFFIEAKSIPEAFEKTMHKVWFEGTAVKTEYDRPDDPPSRDATVMIKVEDPFSQPRFHRSFADGLGGLAEYVMEVVYGAHDYWVKPREEIQKGDSSLDKRWTYTYHQRLFEYEIDNRTINQIDYMIKKLGESDYSRRAQAITWNVFLDTPTQDPPCLQRIWGRITRDKNNKPYFNMNTHWRSRDLYKAWFENVIALTTLQRKIAEKLSEKLNEEIFVGRYVDISDSLHIYGSYFNEIQGSSREGIKGFFDALQCREFEDRTWNSEFVKPFFIDDGLGKGLKNMLEREKDMPTPVKEAIQKEYELLQDENYIV